MKDSAEKEDFETAAFYRDQIRNLQLVGQTQGVVQAGSEIDRDSVFLARRNQLAHGVFVLVRAGKLVGVKHYELQNFDESMDEDEAYLNLLSQHYLNQNEMESKPGHSPTSPPVEVLLPQIPKAYEALEKTISITFKEPEDKEDERLIEVAKSNAFHALERLEKRAQGHGMKAVEEVAKKLHLARLPQRIECYDISNFQGEDSVASRVVFIEGAPDKNLYRRYKIKSVSGQNDFAMMKEVLGRRFSNQKEELPDLVVVDGGKGQLSQATAILEELNVQGVEVCGLAKARTERAFQEKEVEASMERIFIPNRKNPIQLLPHSRAYRLLVHIRDEAHRFAVSYHRHVRKKRLMN